MDGEVAGTNMTLRDKIIEASQQATWIPEFGKARELDWLRNMHDWMISKKRLLRPSAADLRVQCVRGSRGHRLGDGAGGAGAVGLGRVRGAQPAPALGRRSEDRLPQVRRDRGAHQGRR
jgi:hypothetical protein